MGNKLVAAAGVDSAAEKGGAWFEYSPDGASTFKIKLRRAGTGNPEFMKKQADLLKPWRLGARAGSTPNIPHDKDREIMRKLYASTIVTDWDAEAFGVPFSESECIGTFEALNDFLDWVINTSNAADNYRRAEIEANAGN